MKKKVLSIVLSMLMVLSFMPASIFAEDEAAQTPVNITVDEANDNITADETEDADNTVDIAKSTGESKDAADNSAKEQQASSITIQITLPEGLSAEGMDEDTRLVTCVAGENGEIDPIVISCEDEGVFSAKLAKAINTNSSFQESGLNAAYSAKSDTLTISGSPTKSIELDMEEILAAAMEEIGAYDAKTVTDECIQIGSNTYASLEAAVAAASDGDTLWLIGDDAAVQQVTIDKSLTIELQGHKLSSTALKVTGSSTTVTINDRVGTGSINGNRAAGFSTDYNRCTATIVVANLATLTINGVTGTSKDNGTIVYDCANKDLEKAIFVQGASKLIINGGTFVAQQSAGCDALYVYDGTVTINDGYLFMNLSYQTAPSTEKPLTIKKCEIYNPSDSGAIWIQSSGTINGITFSSGFQSLDSIKKLFLSDAAGNYIIDGSAKNHVKIGCGIYVSTEVSSTTLADGTLYCVGQASETSPEQITPSEGAKITLAPQIAGGDGTTISYKWEKDGSTLSDATGATYTIDSYEGSDDGTYKVTATGGDNSVSLYYQIGAGGSDADAHIHCICGKTDCSGDGHDDTTAWTEWTSDNSLPTDEGSYYLTTDVTLSWTWNVSNTVKLCLNGKQIIGASGADVIKVESGGNLNITDCTTDSSKVGKITHTEGSGRGIKNEGTLTLWNGTITGNTTYTEGGGVYNSSNCTFTMYGGSITDNDASGYSDGGGVSNYGIFNMYGGSITTNRSNFHGGGVWNWRTVNLSGNVTISGNTEDGKVSNLYMYDTEAVSHINVEGSLADTASVGITIENKARTTDVGGTTSSTGLFCDNENYEFVPNGSGGLKLMAVHKHCICGKATAEGDTHTHDKATKWTAWTSDNSLPTEAGSYYLMQGVTLTEIWTVSNDIKLCLNGQTITGAAGKNVIQVARGGSITITDCGSSGKITHNTGASGRGISSSGTLNLYGGAISGNTKDWDGAGVNLGFSGTFNMYGGVISENNDTGNRCGGGGVYVGYDTTFNLYGGSIMGNSSKNCGGGVFVDKDTNGQSYGTFNMYGGSITGNSAEDGGGGVYNSDPFNMSGDVTIKDNRKGSADNNVQGTVTVVGGGMTTGASVGITGSENQTVVIGTTSTTGFFSDNTDYDLVANSDNTGLKLAGHSWSNQWTQNDTHHWHICTNAGCEESKDYAEHSYTCEVPCSAYLKTDATCTAKAVYYKSCACGKVGTETFESGEMAKHSYGDLIPKKDATCIEAGMNAYYQCSVCKKYFDKDKAETTLDNLIISVDSSNHDLERHDAKSATCTEKGWKAYDTCKRTGCDYTTYEEIPALGHDMTEVSAKAATTSAEGNINYWYCDRCGKYFGDEDGEIEITEADTIIKKLPLIIKGDNAKLTQGMKKALSFTSDAEFADFIRVDLDGATLDAKYYTVESGSTIVTLNADYVATLAIGEHTLDIVSQNGTATARFTINTADKSAANDNAKSAKTGDNSNIALWLAIVLAGGGALTATRLAGRRRKYSR